jgi:aminomethyltransferase
VKRTPFYTIHKQLGAKLIEFGGYEMPVQYEGILAEHKAVRSSLGVFDVSHMGEVEVKGKNAKAFLQRLTTNDVSVLENGKAQYSAMLYDNGTVVDDLIVYRMTDEHYFLIINASNTEKDVEWMKQHLMPDMTLDNISDAMSLLAVQGKNAEAALQKLTSVNLAAIKYYHFAEGTLAGAPMIISRTGYTGEPGFELCFKNEFAESAWNALFDAGKPFSIKPIGLGARDTLRLEMGYSLYGHEIDDTTNPIEAGLGWITKLDKGEFIGREACVTAKATASRKLIGFVLKERAIARQGFEICDEAGRVIGKVCSGTLSPMLDKPIGTGYVETAFAKPGGKIFLKIRGTLSEADVTKPPFIKVS